MEFCDTPAALDALAKELSYRLAQTLDHIIRTTGIPCCLCGSPASHIFEVQYQEEIQLCDGCWFRWQVMRAAGREKEFLNAR